MTDLQWESFPADDWKRDAACRNVPSEQISSIFFPVVYTQRTRAESNLLCSSCEVIDRCLQYALAQPSLQGIWAKTNELERDQIRRRRHRLLFKSRSARI